MSAVIVVTVAMVTALLTVRPLVDFFQFEQPTLSQVAIAFVAGFASVAWFEIVKGIRRIRDRVVRTP